MQQDTSARNFDPLAVPVKMRVSPAAARHLAKLGVETVGDAIRYAPRRYFHWGKLTPLSELTVGEDTTVLARVTSAVLLRNRSGKGVRLVVGITDGMSNLTCTFFARTEYALSHHRRLLQPGETFLFAGKVSEYQGDLQLVQPSFEEIEADSPEQIRRRSGRPIPIYPAKSSVPSWKIEALLKQIMETINWGQIPDPVEPGLREELGLLPLAEAYRMLHEPEDDTDWQQAIRTLAFVEALTLQTALLQPRAQAQAEGQDRAKPLQAPTADPLTDQVVRQLPFTLTDGQKAAWAEIEKDLAADNPMQRLLQADVGAGKTVVALLALLRAVEAGSQAALLAPTEVLANQHFASITRLLGAMDVPVYLLTGSQKSSTKNNTLQHLAAGAPGIVIGTHALIQDGVDIPNLSLLVVDEQHRFGVSQREKLRKGRAQLPHLLVMTATPIPRTVAMTVFGDLDITLMRELPKGRSPVQTYRVPQENPAWMNRLWERAHEEVTQGGRVYVVVPRISETEDDDLKLPSVEKVAQELRQEPALRGIPIGVAHGQAEAEENSAVLQEFADGRVPILVATTVVEVGVDVPEATMMVIWGAQQFGLSQLHQLRGRVGRSDRESVAMLVHPVELSPTSEERLQALVDNHDGFTLAEVDLRLRQEGDVLGQQQSGARSSLKFLSIRRDGALIASARKAAQQLLLQDPTLGEHLELRAAVDAARGEQLSWLSSN